MSKKNVSLKEDIDSSEYEHILESRVKVYETYNQVYDENDDTFYAGESDFENVEEPTEKHICSCGEEFESRENAYDHLRNNK